MTSFVKRLFLFMILIAFGIMLGIQISGSNGAPIEEVTTLPVTKEIIETATIVEQEQAVSVPDKPQIVTPREVLVTTPGKEPAVDRFAEKTAGLLQQASKQGIRWVVSLFNGVTE